MSDAIIVAAFGAVFNAGVLWATLRFILWRQDRTDESTRRAHERIDALVSAK